MSSLSWLIVIGMVLSSRVFTAEISNFLNDSIDFKTSVSSDNLNAPYDSGTTTRSGEIQKAKFKKISSEKNTPAVNKKTGKSPSQLKTFSPPDEPETEKPKKEKKKSRKKKSRVKKKQKKTNTVKNLFKPKGFNRKKWEKFKNLSKPKEKKVNTEIQKTDSLAKENQDNVSPDTTAGEMDIFKVDFDLFDTKPKELPQKRKKQEEREIAATLDSTRYLDTTFHDNYYFIGTHDNSNVIFHFAFKRKSYGGRKNIYDGNFNGILEWKGKWLRLEPREYPVSIFSKRHYPEHPAFDFKWPSSVSRGEFLYHFNQVYLSVVFNQLQPLVRIANKPNYQSEMFITNALLQGHTHEISGLLLYHRIRLKAPHLFSHELRNQAELNTGPSKFFLFNAPGGITFLGWSRYPFPGAGPEKFILQIQNDGTIHSSRREVDFLVTEADSGIYSRLQKRWTLFLPPLGFKMDLKSRSYSARWDNAVYYGINGTVFLPERESSLQGLLVDTRTESPETTLVAEPKSKKLHKWWKIRQNTNAIFAAHKSSQKSGSYKKVMEDMNRKKTDEKLKKESWKKWYQFWKRQPTRKPADRSPANGKDISIKKNKEEDVKKETSKRWWRFWKREPSGKVNASHREKENKTTIKGKNKGTVIHTRAMQTDSTSKPQETKSRNSK